MSFNNNHSTPLHLTRDNYEEAFLLYVDEELTADQKAAVEAFAALHPDLQEELDLLLNTKLPALENVAVMDKSFLMAHSMKAATIDEDLLLYIDNELAPAQKEAVEEKLGKDTDYMEQHRLLAKTKLDAAEIITYPYKKELYRRTERRIYAAWWRVAAAAVLVLWAGTTTDWFDGADTTGNSNSGPVALQTPAASTPAPADNKVIEDAAAKVSSTPITIEEVIANKQKETKTFTQPAIQKETTKANPTENNSAATTQPAADRVNAVQTSVDYIPAAPQQIFNEAVVTSAEPVRTISTDAHTTTPVPVEEAVATAGSEKGGSLKGFLRKTTRFIERTTSINPVNADNELLIGVLAINVK